MHNDTHTAVRLSRLTLKSFKTVKWMSEETICFTATICLDGKVVGEASNEGHGGSTFVRFVSPAAEATAEQFSNTICPGDVKGWEFMAGKPFAFSELVDIIVERRNEADELKKILAGVRRKASKEMTWLKADSKRGEYYTMKKPLAAGHTPEKLAEIVKAKPGFKCFVSDMTDEEIALHFIS